VAAFATKTDPEWLCVAACCLLFMCLSHLAVKAVLTGGRLYPVLYAAQMACLKCMVPWTRCAT